MSMTRANAKIYVARIIAGGNTGTVLDMADEAIIVAYEHWQSKRYWRFLLKDSTPGFRVTGLTLTNASATVSTPVLTPGVLDGVNPGVTVTVTGTATLPANTTVSSVVYSPTDGTITSIILSNPFGGTTDAAGVLIFSGDIPIVAGQRTYNVPPDFDRPSGARMVGAPTYSLTWKDPRSWDRTIINQTVQGAPREYTVFNAYSPLTQNFGTKKLMLDVIPSDPNTMTMKYFRKFNINATNIDIPDEFLLMFLDYARARLLETKKAQDNPDAYIASVDKAQEAASEKDEQPSDDDDADQCLKSAYENGAGRPLWGNGDFTPFRDW
jgi:hypothetical protein